MARGLGIPVAELPEEDQYVLLGLNDRWEWKGERWVRLAAELPETVRSVEFFRNGDRVDVAWEEPFYVNEETTWIQGGVADPFRGRLEGRRPSRRRPRPGADGRAEVSSNTPEYGFC